jgi:hypothetical protein
VADGYRLGARVGKRIIKADALFKKEGVIFYKTG